MKRFNRKLDLLQGVVQTLPLQSVLIACAVTLLDTVELVQVTVVLVVNHFMDSVIKFKLITTLHCTLSPLTTRVL